MKTDTAVNIPMPLQAAIAQFVIETNRNSNIVQVQLREIRDNKEFGYSLMFDVRMRFAEEETFINLEAYKKGEAHLHLSKKFFETVEQNAVDRLGVKLGWNNTGSAFWTLGGVKVRS